MAHTRITSFNGTKTIEDSIKQASGENKLSKSQINELVNAIPQSMRTWPPYVSNSDHSHDSYSVSVEINNEHILIGTNLGFLSVYVFVHKNYQIIGEQRGTYFSSAHRNYIKLKRIVASPFTAIL